MWLQEIDLITGYRTRSMMCHPIKDSLGDVIGVAQVINKVNEGHFGPGDEAVFEKYLQGSILRISISECVLLIRFNE
jgi:hypothetical protein